MRLLPGNAGGLRQWQRRARDRLARTLLGGAEASFSVEMAAEPGDLALKVEGFGPVRMPVTPARARKLLALGQPASFGRGEQTPRCAIRGRSPYTS